MITEDGRNVSPYKGVAYTNVLFLVIPWLIMALLYPTIKEFGNMDNESTFFLSLLVSYFVGLLFELICVICGITHDCFMAVFNRIKHFFSNLTLSFKLAVYEYKEEVKETGMAYWCYFIVINFTLLMTIGSALYIYSKFLKDLI